MIEAALLLCDFFRSEALKRLVSATDDVAGWGADAVELLMFRTTAER